MWFAGGLCVVTVTLAGLAFVAIESWRQNTDSLRRSRARETIALLDAQLARDMRGAFTSIAMPVNLRVLDADPPFNLLHLTAQAFARFPYPDSFVVWTKNGSRESVFAFNRTDRPPSWSDFTDQTEPFPVFVVRDPPALQDLANTLQDYAKRGETFVVLHRTIHGVPHQILAHNLFTSSAPHEPAAIVALIVNLDWVRANYFEPILRQVSRIGSRTDALVLDITDDKGTVVSRSADLERGLVTIERQFALLFMDPTWGLRTAFDRQRHAEWAMRVQVEASNSLVSSSESAGAIFTFLVVALAASMSGLILAIRADRANAALSSLKADFVSSVTHELKTPIASIRLIAETLQGGRRGGPKDIQDYASLLSQESKRLGRSLDNMLLLARYTEMLLEYRMAFRPASVADVMQEALDDYAPQLEAAGFTIQNDIPDDLPLINADYRALILVIGNLIDNAIKYSDDRRELAVRAHASKRSIHLFVADRGIGIHREDIAHVFDRFWRGRNAAKDGSGLGLTIVANVIRAHGGTVQVRSSPEGTTIELQVPIRSEG